MTPQLEESCLDAKVFLGVPSLNQVTDGVYPVLFFGKGEAVGCSLSSTKTSTYRAMQRAGFHEDPWHEWPGSYCRLNQLHQGAAMSAGPCRIGPFTRFGSLHWPVLSALPGSLV